jgi:F0F1-type ATP synthase delta subunit
MDLAKFLEETPPNEVAFIRVILAGKPTSDFKERFPSAVISSLSREIQLSYETDPGLIAGGILRFENELIDGSLKGQIKAFQKRYQEIA